MIDFNTWKRMNADDLQAGWDEWASKEFASIEDFLSFFYEEFRKEIHKRRKRGVGRRAAA